jgi:chaperonin GroES
VKPLHDRVVVKRIEAEKVSPGGIIIPDTAKEKPLEGEVVAVGNGLVLNDGAVRELDVKVGDRVLFSPYAGTEVKIDGELRLVMRESDIVGTLKGGKLSPLGGRVLVKDLVEEYKGRIILPHTATKNPVVCGTVVAVGLGMLMKNGERWPIGVRAGDVAFFEKDAGRVITIEGQKYRVVRDESLVAVMEK